MGLFSSIGKLAGGLIGGKTGAKIGGAIGGVGDALKGGKKASAAAQAAAQQATPVPYSTTSPYGSVTVDQTGKSIAFNPADSPWGRVLQSIGLSQYANAATAPGSAYYGASPEIVAAAQGFSPQAMQGDVNSELQRLRQLAAPEENRMFQGLENALYSRGMMGTSGGGERYRGFYEAQNQADLARVGAAQDFARQRSMDRFNTALQAVGAGRDAASEQFSQGSVSFQGFQSILDQLQRQANVGVGAGGGTPSEIAKWAAEQKIGNSPMVQLEASGAFDQLANALLGSRGTGIPSPTKVTNDMISSLPNVSGTNWLGG